MTEDSLAYGTTLRALCGDILVLDRIGGGTQGDVYRIKYNGKLKALKWYKTNIFINRDEFVRNLQRNIDAGAPTSEFLWPLDRTKVDAGGHFGYVMDLCSDGFLSADDLFIQPNRFPSYKRIVDACMNIAQAFGELHDRGYVYRDISGGNFFINPLSGKVLICDNDNVAAGNRDTGIRGTPRFMAPEIVVTNNNPTEACDRHSLSVIIFYLLLMQHPLEGRRMGMLTGDVQRKLYGEEPLFIFDPNDMSNAPIPCDDEGNRNNALMIWPQLPGHMRAMLTKAFSQAALKRGAARPDEAEWIYELTRLRTEVVRCPRCQKHEMFLENAVSSVCDDDGCKARVSTSLCLEPSLTNYRLPLVADTRLFACQTSLVTSTVHAADPIAWVVAATDGSGDLGIKNVSKAPWRIRGNGFNYVIYPGQYAPVYVGMEMVVGDGTVRICANRE